MIPLDAIGRTGGGHLVPSTRWTSALALDRFCLNFVFGTNRNPRFPLNVLSLIIQWRLLREAAQESAVQ